MQMFLDYDVGKAKVESLGLAGPRMILKERANWVSFIKVRKPTVTVACLSVMSAVLQSILHAGQATGSVRPIGFLLSSFPQQTVP